MSLLLPFAGAAALFALALVFAAFISSLVEDWL
jgi:hypothetical protein